MALLKPYSGLLGMLHRGLDAFLIFAALYGTVWARELEWDRTFAVTAATAAGLFLLIGQAQRLYGS